ncbi:MAG: hypothetical protein ACI4KF_07715 [Huintestinicola sp.]
MTDFDFVCELVNKTGATFEEAKYAYEACGKDMLAAAVMLEKSQNAKKSRSSFINTEAVKENSRKASNALVSFFRKVSRTSVKAEGSREYFSIPSLAAIIIAAILWEIALPAFIISLICGIRYTICGPDLAKDIIIGFTKEQKQTDIVPASYTCASAPSVNIPDEKETDKGIFTNAK